MKLNASDLSGVQEYKKGFRLSVQIAPESVEDAKTAVDNFGDGEIEVTISKRSKKRSLSANNYAWLLIGKIAAMIGTPKDDVYRHAVREIGDNYDAIRIPREAFPGFQQRWEQDHIGWFCDELLINDPEYTDVICYYGSSQYDTRQMSRLIDFLVAEASELGISTMTPEELERMVGAW